MNPSRRRHRNTRALPIWCTLPMALALAPLLIFGLWWPAALLVLFPADRGPAWRGRAVMDDAMSVTSRSCGMIRCRIEDILHTLQQECAEWPR